MRRLYKTSAVVVLMLGVLGLMTCTEREHSNPLDPEYGGGLLDVLQISSDSLDFGSVSVYDWADRSVTLANTASQPVIIKIGTHDPQFRLLQPDSFFIGAGEERSIEFRYLPVAEGRHSGSIDLQTNTAAPPITITVNGTAQRNEHPPLVPFTQHSYLTAGSEFQLDILLGTEEKPVSDVKIVSFELGYDADLVTYIDNSIKAGDLFENPSHTIIPENQKISISVFDTQHVANGYGKLVSLTFKVNYDNRTNMNLSLYFLKSLSNDLNGNIKIFSTKDAALLIR